MTLTHERRANLSRPRASGRVLAAGLVTLAVALAPAFAAGHPAVDEGLARLRGADFAGALEAFDEAERTGELAPPEAARLLEGRAMAALALGDQDVLDDSLGRLAALDPAHAFSPEAPPVITLAFAQARARLADAPAPAQAEPIAPTAEPVFPAPTPAASRPTTEPALLGAREATPARPTLALVHASRAAPPPWAPRPRRPADHPGGRARHVPWGWIGAGVGATVLTAAAVVTAIVLGGSGGGGAGGDAGEGDE